MAISDFQNFEFLTPKNQNFDFWGKLFLQNQNFSKFSKNRNICYVSKCHLCTCQISKQYLNFWPSYCFLSITKSWRHFLKNGFLAKLYMIRQNKCHQWIPETKLVQIDAFLIWILKLWNLTLFDLIWPDLEVKWWYSHHYRILRVK